MPSRFLLALVASICLTGSWASGAHAQISSVDPDSALRSDAPVADSSYSGSGATTDQAVAADTAAPAADGIADPYPGESVEYVQPDTPGNDAAPAYADGAGTLAAPAPGEPDTYQEDDLIAAGSGVFGDGAEGLARMIEDILAEQGEPNGYIVGREAGGAFVVGVRYGSGTLHHRLEGQMPVYWTGPSIGFDFGGNAAQTFVLVYNLHDTDELFQRFPAIEGDAYFIGGLTASYLRSGDKVLIPIRLGAGLRLGANVGYMKFSREQDWLPF